MNTAPPQPGTLRLTRTTLELFAAATGPTVPPVRLCSLTSSDQLSPAVAIRIDPRSHIVSVETATTSRRISSPTAELQPLPLTVAVFRIIGVGSHIPACIPFAPPREDPSSPGGFLQQPLDDGFVMTVIKDDGGDVMAAAATNGARGTRSGQQQRAANILHDVLLAFLDKTVSGQSFQERRATLSAADFSQPAPRDNFAAQPQARFVSGSGADARVPTTTSAAAAGAVVPAAPRARAPRLDIDSAAGSLQPQRSAAVVVAFDRPAKPKYGARQGDGCRGDGPPTSPLSNDMAGSSSGGLRQQGLGHPSARMQRWQQQVLEEAVQQSSVVVGAGHRCVHPLPVATAAATMRRPQDRSNAAAAATLKGLGVLEHLYAEALLQSSGAYKRKQLQHQLQQQQQQASRGGEGLRLRKTVATPLRTPAQRASTLAAQEAADYLTRSERACTPPPSIRRAAESLVGATHHLVTPRNVIPSAAPATRVGVADGVDERSLGDGLAAELVEALEEHCMPDVQQQRHARHITTGHDGEDKNERAAEEGNRRIIAELIAMNAALDEELSLL